MTLHVAEALGNDTHKTNRPILGAGISVTYNYPYNLVRWQVECNTVKDRSAVYVQHGQLMVDELVM